MRILFLKNLASKGHLRIEVSKGLLLAYSKEGENLGRAGRRIKSDNFEILFMFVHNIGKPEDKSSQFRKKIINQR